MIHFVHRERQLAPMDKIKSYENHRDKIKTLSNPLEALQPPKLLLNLIFNPITVLWMSTSRGSKLTSC